jgi:hypothetical protein
MLPAELLRQLMREFTAAGSRVKIVTMEVFDRQEFELSKQAMLQFADCAEQ